MAGSMLCAFQGEDEAMVGERREDRDNALMAGDLSRNKASATVQVAIQALKKEGVEEPTNAPRGR